MDSQSLQEQYASRSTCFGCGPANPKGLRIRSFAAGDELVAEWRPEPYHAAFVGVLNGGVIGTLLDCHSTWAAAHRLMARRELDHPPATVTAGPLRIVARVVEERDDRAIVEGRIEADGAVCATSRGTFVAVRPGHPAYHRW